MEYESEITRIRYVNVYHTYMLYLYYSYDIVQTHLSNMTSVKFLPINFICNNHFHSLIILIDYVVA